MADEEPRVVSRTICFCRERIEHMTSQSFVWCGPQGAWYFPHDPPRTMSASAAYYALHERGQEFHHEDHRGEPYYWTTCPWCGHALPGVTFQGDA